MGDVSMVFNREEVLMLLRAAASSMLGRTVHVYFRTPLVKGSGGRAFAERCEIAAIDVTPGDLDEVYERWLHELVHHHLGHVDYEQFEAFDNSPELRPDDLGYPCQQEWGPKDWQEHDNDPEEADVEVARVSLDRYAERMVVQRFGICSTRLKIVFWTSVVLHKEE